MSVKTEFDSFRADFIPEVSLEMLEAMERAVVEQCRQENKIQTIWDLQCCVTEYSEWTRKAIPNQRLQSVLGHLKQEIDDIMADPSDITEFADAMLLLLHALECAQFSVPQLLEAMQRKQNSI